ncbi:hypothetical protein D3C77_606490 [compost metagenome]
MRRIHIRLDFEHIAGELLVRRLDQSSQAVARFRLRSKAQEIFQKRLNPEIVDGAAEEDRGQFPAAYFLHIKRIARHIEKL